MISSFNSNTRLIDERRPHIARHKASYSSCASGMGGVVALRGDHSVWQMMNQQQSSKKYLTIHGLCDHTSDEARVVILFVVHRAAKHAYYSL